MKTKLFFFIFIVGLFSGYADDVAGQAEKTLTEPATATTFTPASKATAAAAAEDAVKDKRQVGAKETQLYPNHRSDTVEDDPENGQETIYGPRPNQFLIRPMSPHQHQQHEEHEQTQLRNYPVTIRPHNQQQLLEQSQEIQHFAYIQDLTRNHPKAAGAAPLHPEKPQSAKADSGRSAPQPYSATSTAAAAEEAEQRYAYAVQAPAPQLQPRQFKPSVPYQVSETSRQPQPPPHQHQQSQQQQQQQPQQQQYQVIPEEQFLKLIEEELQARAYQDAQSAQQRRQQQQHRQQQQQHHQQPQQQQPQRHYRIPSSQSQLDSANKVHQAELAERSASGGLGSYRQRLSEEPSGDYIQYIAKPRGGPKYLPETQQPHPLEVPLGPTPPRLGYFKPTHNTYKSSLPNHPLAKSSLEKEIEKLLAANKPSAEALDIVDNLNDPSGFINEHHHQQQSPPNRHHQPKSSLQPKRAYSTTPNTLVDANNQPFVPSLFQFRNYQQPLPIHPTQLAPNLGPVVYPTTVPGSQPAQPSQYYYQEAQPTPNSRPYRSKQYGNKIATFNASNLKATRQKEAAKLQSYDYEYERGEPHLQTGPGQLYSSPRDPTDHQQKQTESRPRSAPSGAPQSPSRLNTFNPFALPAAAPSQSSIYVSQGTGITTPSRPVHKPAKKTAEDVRQLKLPQPGDKPLTQSEFQALIDAGYPVTAVPVPVPVPYDQYIKENPEHRGQSVEYPLMRLAQQYAPLAPRHQQQQQHLLAVSSDPAVKIISSPTEPKTTTAVGPDGVTYLRPIEHRQQRHPREEKDTAVDGKKDA